MNTSPLDAVAVINRAQLPHIAHKRNLQVALDSAEHVVDFLGSSFCARNPRNPWVWTERRDMLSLMLGKDAERVSFVPVRDYYDDQRWAGAVESEMEKIVPRGKRIGLVGYRKDATSDYLGFFDAWTPVAVSPMPGIDSTPLRKAYFESDSVKAALMVLKPYVEPAVLDYLEAWSHLPAYQERREEALAVRAYRQEYPALFYLTADAVVRVNDHILLIKRDSPFGRDQWALPGGFLNPGERSFMACLRELQEEACLKLLRSTMQRALRDKDIFDHPLRSPRGGLVSHAYYFDLGWMQDLPEVHGKDDAREARWWAIKDIPSIQAMLFEDHYTILERFMGRSIMDQYEAIFRKLMPSSWTGVLH